MKTVGKFFAMCLCLPMLLSVSSINQAMGIKSSVQNDENHVIRIEAEDYASKNGNIYVRNNGDSVPTGNADNSSITLTGASGGKFLDFCDPVPDYTSKYAYKNTLGASDNVSWSVTVPKSGFYRIKFIYNNPGTRWGGKRNTRDERNCRVLINGDQSNPLSTKGWEGWMIFSVSGYNDTAAEGAIQSAETISGNTKWNTNYMSLYMPEGTNTLTLVIEAPPGQGVYDGPNLDYFEVEYIGDQYISPEDLPTISGEFNHPGIYMTMDDLQTMKANKDKVGTYWNDGYTSLINNKLSKSTYTRTDKDTNTGTIYYKIVERGPYNKPNIGSGSFINDCTAAYYNALRWYLDGDIANAKKAIEIMNGWSHTLTDIVNNDAKLIVGMSSSDMISAAEIIKHVYNNDPSIAEEDKWSAADMKQFDKMVREVLYDKVICDYYPQANGNWDALITSTNMAIGIYLDDADIFNRAIRQYYTGDVIPGTLSMGSLPSYIYPTGESQESNRDQGHAGMGMTGLGKSCEIAWNQGIDLFSAYNDRLLLGANYNATYNVLKESVPSETFISDKNRGGLGHPTFDILYNHYVNQLGEDPEDYELIKQAADKGTAIQDMIFLEDTSEQSRSKVNGVEISVKDGKPALKNKGDTVILQANVDTLSTIKSVIWHMDEEAQKYVSLSVSENNEAILKLDKYPEKNLTITVSAASRKNPSVVDIQEISVADGSTEQEVVTSAAIQGTVKVGKTLTAEITPSPSETTNVTYQWQSADTKNGEYTDIEEANAATFTLTSKQKGKYIRVVVHGDNGYCVTSEPIGKVSAKKSNSGSSHSSKHSSYHSSSSKKSTAYSSSHVIHESDGRAIVAVEAAPDSTPRVTNDTTSFSVTVAPNVSTQAKSFASAQKHAKVEITLPDTTVIDELNNQSNQAVNMSINLPGDIAYNTAENVDVILKMNTAILSSIKHSQKKVTVSVIDTSTNKKAYSWTFNGKELSNATTELTDINLAINTKTSTLDPSLTQVINSSIKGAELTFANGSKLPAMATIKVYIADQGFKAGQTAYVYKYDAATKQLEAMQNPICTVDADGYATISVNDCSQYVFLPQQVGTASSVKLDTGNELYVKRGQTYQFKITASSKPTFVCGNSSMFKVDFSGSRGNDYFFKVTAIGKPSECAGFYVNSEKQPRTIGEIL